MAKNPNTDDIGFTKSLIHKINVGPIICNHLLEHKPNINTFSSQFPQLTASFHKGGHKSKKTKRRINYGRKKTKRHKYKCKPNV
jgi:hypothetical protein